MIFPSVLTSGSTRKYQILENLYPDIPASPSRLPRALKKKKKKTQRHLGKGGIPGWSPRIGNHGKWRKFKKNLDFSCELCVSVDSSALAVHRRLLRIWAPEMKCISRCSFRSACSPTAGTPEFSACFVPLCLHVDVRSPVVRIFLGKHEI